MVVHALLAAAGGDSAGKGMPKVITVYTLLISGDTYCVFSETQVFLNVKGWSSIMTIEDRLNELGVW